MAKHPAPEDSAKKSRGIGPMLSILKETFGGFIEDNCPRIAAALAYSAAFSLAPMLVVIISVCQVVFDPEDVRGAVEQELISVVGNEGAEQVKAMIDSSGKSDQERGAFFTAVGVVLMLIGATGFFAQLQAGMNDVWEVKPDPAKNTLKYFLGKRLLSLGMVLSLSFLVSVTLVASVILRAFDDAIDRLPSLAGSTLLSVTNNGVTFFLLTALFAAIFQVLPDARVRWRDVLMGAAGTALLFMVGKLALAFYLSRQNLADSYGAAGSLVLVLVWVYFSTMILLFGAEFTQVWARRQGRRIRPSHGAVRVITKTEGR